MELMAYLLNAFGHTVLQAFNGEDGLETARSELPDLLVCDVHLPKMDGYGVLRQLKSEAALRRIPVIAVTAFAMKGDEEKIREGGCEAYIAKPISVANFLQTVERFLT